MRNIYIAGKISGECETSELMQNCINKFNDYAKTLSFSPLRYLPNQKCVTDGNCLKVTHGLMINSDILGKGTWKQYMKNDLSILLKCDEIHMLPDWKDSKGAKIEHQLALDLGIKIVYV
jgi:hypothetical protein